ncbi:MAG: hypothetical protein SPH07_01475 [Eubacteriales bacterium]|nr:hypothetical protein [Eubacteriales bacterium]MDY5440247.1 hypothetical protein [Eubacteriales bacterium]
MAFVKVSKEMKRKMFREGGYREREIMKNSICTTTAYGRKDCVKFHDKKNDKTAVYKYGRGWIE